MAAPPAPVSSIFSVWLCLLLPAVTSRAMAAYSAPPEGQPHPAFVQEQGHSRAPTSLLLFSLVMPCPGWGNRCGS